jgi:hypothetical protein
MDDSYYLPGLEGFLKKSDTAIACSLLLQKTSREEVVRIIHQYGSQLFAMGILLKRGLSVPEVEEVASFLVRNKPNTVNYDLICQSVSLKKSDETIDTVLSNLYRKRTII